MFLVLLMIAFCVPAAFLFRFVILFLVCSRIPLFCSLLGGCFLIKVYYKGLIGPGAPMEFRPAVLLLLFLRSCSDFFLPISNATSGYVRDEGNLVPRLLL